MAVLKPEKCVVQKKNEDFLGFKENISKKKNEKMN